MKSKAGPWKRKLLDISQVLCVQREQPSILIITRLMSHGIGRFWPQRGFPVMTQFSSELSNCPQNLWYQFQTLSGDFVMLGARTPRKGSCSSYVGCSSYSQVGSRVGSLLRTLDCRNSSPEAQHVSQGVGIRTGAPWALGGQSFHRKTRYWVCGNTLGAVAWLPYFPCPCCYRHCTFIVWFSQQPGKVNVIVPFHR